MSCQQQIGKFQNSQEEYCLFKNKKVFNAGSYFMENFSPSRNPCICFTGLYCYQSVTLGQKCGQSHYLNSIRNVLEVLTVFQFMPTLYRDHENFGKSTTIFIQTFIKTLVILRVNKHFGRKFCESVLFNNYFPFSIKIPVKYNTVLLVVNKMAKIP